MSILVFATILILSICMGCELVELCLSAFTFYFTPVAMVIAQALLATPIITTLTRRIIEEPWQEYCGALRIDGAIQLRVDPDASRDRTPLRRDRRVRVRYRLFEKTTDDPATLLFCGT